MSMFTYSPGACLLDFYWVWTWQAIKYREPDKAYEYSRRLAHYCLGLRAQGLM